VEEVGVGICVRDDYEAFVLTHTEWFTPMLGVYIGETLGLLSVIKRVKDLQMWNMDFEVDSKR